MESAEKENAKLPLESSGKAEPKKSDLPDRHRLRQIWWLPLSLAFLIVGSVAGLNFQPPILYTALKAIGLQVGGGTYSPFAVADVATEDGAPIVVPESLVVAALGRLSPKGGAVALAFPHGAGDARVARLLVTEGDQVKAGQVLAELDNLPQLMAQMKSAAAAVAAAEASLEQIRASVKVSLLEANAGHAQAVAAMLLASQELSRVSALAMRGLDTEARLEQAQAAAEQARAEEGRTLALIERFSGAEDNLQPDILVAMRNVDVARASLSLAESDVAGATVLAPQAGTVLAIHSRPGEKPADAGVMTVGSIDQMTAELEVYQTDIGRVALG